MTWGLLKKNGGEIVAFVLLSFGLTTNIVFANSDSLNDGKGLTEELVQAAKSGEDTVKIWSELTNKERASIKEFIKPVKPFMDKFNENNVNENEMNEAYNNLSEDMKLAAIAYLLPIKETNTYQDSPLIHPTHHGKHSWKAPVDRRNAINVLMARYNHEITIYSYSTSKVTSASRFAWGKVHHNGWQFNGINYGRTSGGSGHSYYTSQAQGLFQLNAFGFVISGWYPLSEFGVRANGNYYPL